jgi:autotransporter-associated beta strand protein
LTAIFTGGGASVAASSVTGITVAANTGCGMTFKNSGTTTLSSTAGTNTYTGLTTVSGGGTLKYGANDQIAAGAVTANGATLDLATFTDTVGTVTLQGGGALSRTGATLATQGVLTSTGTFEMQSGTASAILAGSGIALNKTTGGTVTLSGANTYSGATNVTEGTLALASTGSLVSDALVLGSSTTTGTFDVSLKGAYNLSSVSGRGTVKLANNATALTVNGTLAPGFSPGTVTVAGDLSLGSSSVSNFEVNGATAGLYDLAQGTVDSNEQVTFGGTLNVAFDPAWTATLVINTSVQLFSFDAYADDFTTKTFTGLQEGQSASFDAATGTVAIAVPEPAVSPSL